MRTVEVLELAFVRANLAAAAAVIVVLLLRRPARAAFGCELAYALWMSPLFAAAASLFPTIGEYAAAGLLPSVGGAHVPLASGVFEDHPAAARLAKALLVVWAAGVLAQLALLVGREHAFRRAARAGRAGPAVAGVLWPRIVTPVGYAARFTPAQRAVILAHEQQHVARGDTRANAAIAACSVLAWFNPLVHLAARAARLDQELACDAGVLSRGLFRRRDYALALAAAHRPGAASPLACAWVAAGEHPLLVRLSLLALPEPGPTRRIAGAMAVMVLALALAAGAWIALPPGGALATAVLR